MLDVTDSVEAFRQILCACWPAIQRLAETDTTGSFKEDWLQANWERVVECSVPPSLGVVLEPYGEGADCNVRSSRVWKPTAIANSAISIRCLGNEAVTNALDGQVLEGDLILGEFCTLVNGWPSVQKPFDYVTLENRENATIPVANLKYYLCRMHA